MIRPRCPSLLFVATALLATVSTAVAEVRLPSIIGEGMVLQRDRGVPIWGWDDPGTVVTVTIGAASAKGTADKEGKWLVTLPKMAAGGPHEVKIAGTNEVTLGDVLVGEVWLCSGQSNMEWQVSQSDNAKEEVAAADHPRIRHIKIPHTPSDKPESDVPSDGWKVANPANVGSFTGVGYYFGRALQQELDVPIGLIGSNWGGTRIEPWTPPEGFQAVPSLKANYADKLNEYPTKRPNGTIDHQSPLALYNGMISPLLPYAIRGAIWYQGESNRNDGVGYQAKMEALIKGWRKVWADDAMPFYFVQLAPYRYGGEGDAVTLIPQVWEAQQKTLALPHTGMAVTLDIGNVGNIHPTNKQEVGRRLALWALAKTYGKEGTVYSGPLYKSSKVEGQAIRIAFDHVGSGLVARDGKPLSHFQIAGADGEFVDATAKIDGATVVVASDSVAEPVAVRYGWHQEAEPNLSNKEGLPASPFRTDSEK